MPILTYCHTNSNSQEVHDFLGRKLIISFDYTIKSSISIIISFDYTNRSYDKKTMVIETRKTAAYLTLIRTCNRFYHLLLKT